MEKKESSSLTRKVSSKSATHSPRQEASSNATPSRLIRKPEVLRMTGLPTSTMYALMARGSFPRPVKLGVRSVAWPEEAVLAWIAARPVAELRTEEAAG